MRLWGWAILLVADAAWAGGDAGEYASSSEVVRDALREWMQRRKLRQEGVATLRKAWRQATRESSAGVDAEGVLRRLGRKYEAMAKVAEQGS